ncbi:MAG: GtrA family protein [Oscillospiraceae bacterium]|nr:GtrA family protein [Oscillospiraceae bacterium]
MKSKEWLRTLKFLLFSVSAGIIQLGGFALLNELLHLDYWISYLIALVASVLWNFTFNRRYTFKSDGKVVRAMLLVFAYYCVFTPVSTWLEHQLAGNLGWNEYLVTVINMLLNFITEFLFQRFVVYRNSLDTNDLAKK